MQWGMVAILILCAFYTDVRGSIIPNGITMSGIVWGISYHWITAGLTGLIFSLIGLLTGFAIHFALYLFGALGAGDVKLFASIGALTGVAFVWECSIYSIIYAGVIGFIILICKKQFVQKIKRLFFTLLELYILKDLRTFQGIKKQSLLRFPFMYAVLPGVLTAGYNWMH